MEHQMIWLLRLLRRSGWAKAPMTKAQLHARHALPSARDEGGRMDWYRMMRVRDYCWERWFKTRSEWWWERWVCAYNRLNMLRYCRPN